MTTGKRCNLHSAILYLKVNSNFQIYCQEDPDDLKLNQYSVLLFDVADKALFKENQLGFFSDLLYLAVIHVKCIFLHCYKYIYICILLTMCRTYCSLSNDSAVMFTTKSGRQKKSVLPFRNFLKYLSSLTTLSFLGCISCHLISISVIQLLLF